MSKQDTHFFNMFSLVLGILIAIAVVLFVYARHVGNTTQVAQLKDEEIRLAAVKERTQPGAQVAVAGQDNSALAIVEKSAGPAPSAAAMPKDGEGVYKAACSACHGLGVAGAPKFGDKAAWAPRVAKGLDTLHKHAIEGFQGTAGVMPAKGGRMDFPDDVVKMGVDYMVQGSK